MKILVVDDQRDVIQSLQNTLSQHEVIGASSIRECLQLLKKESFDIIFIDLMLGQEDGLELLKEIRANYPNTICVMISGQGNIQKAVESIHLGAFDFVEKPLSLQRIKIILKNASTNIKLNKLTSQQLERYALLGQSKAIQHIRSLIDKAARFDMPVLITGPSGSGKEHVAHLIHLKSPRNENEMVKLNCSSIPQELFESEFFGSVKGAYTGSHQDRKGKILMAHQGTLFLDEMGEMPLSQQAKLLRVLEEKKNSVLWVVKKCWKVTSDSLPPPTVLFNKRFNQANSVKTSCFGSPSL